MKRLFRKFKFHVLRRVLGCFIRVRVYDNYVENIKPALCFRNKVRYSLKQWIPIGSDSPFGRLVYIKGHAVECGSPIVAFGRLSGMEIHFTKNGSEFVWTHWQEQA